ncbi:MAG: threonine synthase [Rikenellaceae bacterium]|nr:threonine synthase [Rikenellaceae bacterium]
MKLYGTINKSQIFTFKEAVILGIPPEGGLFVPMELPVMDPSFFTEASKMSFPEIALELSFKVLGEEFSHTELKSIIDKAFDFEIELKNLGNDFKVLELFHGPTLAFKDVGARFMAGVLASIANESDKERMILAATSGDTGSAVASSFHNVPGIKVVLLYPSGKVSASQEKQLTTYGGNITALEVKGSFDDCQKLVKEAFADTRLKNRLGLTSANSINIARLLPQSFYYHYAASRATSKKVVFSVPTGNMGNLTGGLIASAMGLDVSKFIAAVNSNQSIPKYLSTGQHTPLPTIPTISNAMDVGNPSNLERVISMFGNDLGKINNVIFSESFDDKMTLEAINKVYKEHEYTMDPHTSVGYLALESYRQRIRSLETDYIVLSTAHPAKFSDVIEKANVPAPEIPQRLKNSLSKDKSAVTIMADLTVFKEMLDSL